MPESEPRPVVVIYAKLGILIEACCCVFYRGMVVVVIVALTCTCVDQQKEHSD